MKSLLEIVIEWACDQKHDEVLKALKDTESLAYDAAIENLKMYEKPSLDKEQENLDQAEEQNISLNFLDVLTWSIQNNYVLVLKSLLKLEEARLLTPEVTVPLTKFAIEIDNKKNRLPLLLKTISQNSFWQFTSSQRADLRSSVFKIRNNIFQQDKNWSSLTLNKGVILFNDSKTQNENQNSDDISDKQESTTCILN